MATILSSSSLTDEPSTSPIHNTPIPGESPTTNNGASPSPLLKKKTDAFVVTLLNEDITKTATVDDFYEEEQEEQEVEKVEEVEEDEEEEMDEEYIADKLFHLETGYKKSKSAPAPARRGDILVLSTVQELKLIHKPLTENFHSQREVASSWAAQIRTFEQLARAFAHFANNIMQFSYMSETTAITSFYHDQLAPVFNHAQDEFVDAQALSQLNAQIDYTHLHKHLPKENALTTAEERKANVAGPLLTRQNIGARRLLYESELTEFVAPTYGNCKKKAAAIMVPKEYRLIVTTDFVYLCQVIQAEPSPSKRFTSSQHKQLRLLHEPVAVSDCQISSTPDVTETQRYMVMVCFYNQTSYILKAKTGEERDAWVQIARVLRIEQPKPSDACREQDENETIQRSNSSAAIGGENSKHKGLSLFKRLKSLRRSTSNLPEAGLHSPEIHPDQVTYTEEEEHARRMQLGQPSLWEVRRLPTDLGVIPPLEHPISFRRDHLYDTNVKIVDMTTGKVAPGEFGMGIEDRAAYHRDGCALFAILRPPRLVKPEDVDKNREDFFLVGKRTINGRDYCAEPPYITDFYARSWLHPNMRIEFDIEANSVVVANMYRILCSSPKMVRLFETYYRYLMSEAKISPDNTFLSMDYRSYPMRVSKKAQKTDLASTGITSATASKSSLPRSGSISAVGGHQRVFNDMGECNIEFRRMSNAEDAISVGFWNPATKRDMAVGVLMVRSSTIRTTSAMGLNTLLSYSVHKCLQRSSPTELIFTLLQTDVQTTPGFRKGQRVIRRTEGTTSLDEYKVEGTRETLNELEDFVRSRIGTDCKAREYRETLLMAKVAFHEDVIDTWEVEEEKEKPQWTNGQVVEPPDDDLVYSHRVEGYLETLHEVPEEEEEKDLSTEPSDVVDDEDAEQIEDEEDLASSTSTFHPKSKQALLAMEKQHQEAAAKESELDTAIQSGFLQLDSTSFSDLTSDGALSAYINAEEDQQQEKQPDTSAPSVADLAKFWDKTTSVVDLVLSPSGSSIASSKSQDFKVAEPSTEAIVVVESSNLPSTASMSRARAPAPTPVPVTASASSELEARMSTMLAMVSSSSLVQVTEAAAALTNASGVIQATRYLLKSRPVEEDRNEVETGVSVEQLRPVADLKKRWEEIHRLGI
ncbi:hypothetical protein BG006_004092 [Podila minutissima]|uniref:PH domain-containing protein n=1 Tax=Podila minutissima TaxID=64525 RepID=A0A9P5SPQ4_9FUNG|nr:hypothetical protein BG006_004092 [Podila minutissima]